MIGFISFRDGGARRQVARRKTVLGAIIAALTVVGLAAADFLTGYYQKQLLEHRRERLKQVQRMAWYQLRADVRDVGYTADGKYRMTVWMENAFPESELYVMAPAIRVFVQVGPRWVEVPAKPATGEELLSEGAVVNLKKRAYAGSEFEIPLDEHFELLPGYMHVRFDNTMFVSPDAEPKDQVIERTDNYYIHLRPIGADDERLRRLNQFPGPVPLWIGMPPH